jgi:Zinc carboxypeptidase
LELIVMTTKTFRLITLTIAFICLIIPGRFRADAQTPNGSNVVPAPETVLGFKIGEERKLATWDKFLAYFRKLEESSDRIKVKELGNTTLKRPFIVATISSAENLKRLDEFKDIQRKLADPRLLVSTDETYINELIRAGKSIVVITCSIHSTEVGGTFTATELAYRLASENTPDVKQILDNVVLFLVPSLNPDGTDIVANWYQKTLGTPAEGMPPPELYHHYTGHDNNRDWYAFTQLETQLTVDNILNAWHPQILHDIHQMRSGGARFFIPPYIDPWEPNIDPAIIAGVSALGTSVAWEMIGQGKSGIVVNGIFDAWTPARAYAHYHGGLRILSETASAKLATPVEVMFDQLGAGPNYNAKTASWNFPKPWAGGKWTLRDIVDYQSAGALALLNHAARHRELYLRNFYQLSRRAVAANGMPYAILMLEPDVPKSLSDAFKRLNSGLKKVSGTPQEQHDKSEALLGSISNEPSTSEEVIYYYKTEGIDRLLSILKRGGVEITRANKDFVADGKSYPAGTHIVLMNQPYSAFARALLEPQIYPDLREYPGGPPKRPYDVTAHDLSQMMNVKTVSIKEKFDADLQLEVIGLILQSRVRTNAGVRAAIYKNHRPSMDEGWTRWIFDQYRFPYTSLLDAEVRSGNLNAKYDVIIIPDQTVEEMVNGLPGKSDGGSSDGESGGGYPAEYAGGLGEAGIKALRGFVEGGGTLITFNNASNFAIEKLGLPVRNVLKGVSVKDFYCPGSILRTQLDSTSALTFGLEKDAIAWFESGPAFEVTDQAKARVIARYPGAANPLLSGWILGDKLIRGKGAMVDAKLGKGRVILFGFRPQYRGQTLATFPLMFNAILTSKPEQQ